MSLEIPDLAWRVQTRAIEQIKVVGRMLQDLVFKVRNPNPSKYIEVDVTKGGRKLAPFVTDIEGGTIIESTRRENRVVKTPRIRPKKILTADDLLGSKAPGQIYYAGGSGDIQTARKKKIATEQKDLKNQIWNRVEWMCVQALTGTMSVVQNNIQFQIDYLMPSAHKIVNVGTDKWTDPGAKVKTQIQAWAQLIIDALGYGPTICICGADAAAALLDRVEDDKWFDARSLSAGQFEWRASSNYMGRAGGIDFYKYGSKYESDSGVDTSLLPANKIYLIATQARFSIEFGLISDLEAQVMGELFSKAWLKKDPSALNIIAESRPLPVVWEPESIVEVQVVD
ncbi:MAG: major capsid protein [Desulfobacterales bacterium]|nr:major capsid protein [Desulfobacterales bacterium]